MTATVERIYKKPLTSPNKHRTITITDGEIGFSLGNMKLPYETAIWNIPALVTCPGAKLQGCATFNQNGGKIGWCYALKAERMYPGVIESRTRNLHASLEDDFEERLFNLVMQVVRFRKVKVTKIRVHEAGDFYNQRYLDIWLRVADRIRKMRRSIGRTIKFYAYTKSIELDFSHRPDNFVVLLSDDKGIWADQYDRFDGVFAIDNPNATLQCIEDCSQCSACVDKKHFHIGVRKH
jgi:hypothetical protein